MRSVGVMTLGCKVNTYESEYVINELKKEYIGQISTYMNYMDKEVKSINHDKTIGIIIVKKDNYFIMEYCSDKRIIRTTYKII